MDARSGGDEENCDRWGRMEFVFEGCDESKLYRNFVDCHGSGGASASSFQMNGDEDRQSGGGNGECSAQSANLTQQPARIYLSSGLFLQPASYENVLEVISVNPNQTLESSASDDANPRPSTNEIDDSAKNLEPSVNCNQRKAPDEEVNEDDDVIFVGAWKIPEAEVPVLPSSSQTPPVRRRRRRRTFGEKRKNPVRKAQINKASQRLAEQLSIPPSVFNARVKRRKPKPQPVSEVKNLRQSCRTSGAIFCPPNPLDKRDFKEWPVSGMHERPFYDKETHTIIKYHIPTPSTGDIIGERTVLSDYNASTTQTQTKNAQSNISSLNITIKEDSPEFATLCLERLKMMCGYFEELKGFSKLVSANKDKENNPTCRSYHKKEKLDVTERYRQFINGHLDDNLKNAATMLLDVLNLCLISSKITEDNLLTLFNTVID